MKTLILALFFIFGCTHGFANNNENKLIGRVVKNLDLDKYEGEWFEIARVPNSFQKKCLKNVTATYGEDAKNKLVTVTNKCEKNDGSQVVANGRARFNSNFKKTKGALEVTFVKLVGNWIFKFVSGNYWVINLGSDADYGFSVIAEPSLKMAWILSRSSSLSKTKLKSAAKSLSDFGYDPCELIMTVQDNGNEKQNTKLCDFLK